MRDDLSAGKSRGRLGCLPALALLVIMPVAVIVALTPWATHIGGRATFLRSWDGFGEVQASNGGRYLLFVTFYGGLLDRMRHSSHGAGASGADNLHGSAALCTVSAGVHSFKLAGVVSAWATTDGARTRIRLTGGAPTKLPSGWVVAWHGAWRGPALELEDPDSSFTKAFTPRGEIRHVTSTADAGTARVTLTYGSRAAFDAACAQLQRRSP